MTTLLARALLLTGASLVPAIAGNQILLRNLNSLDGTPTLLAGGPNGPLYVVSLITSNLTQQPVSRVVELDSNGGRLTSFDLTELPRPAAAIVDSQGNLILVGQDENARGTVWKLDPQLQSAANVVSLPAQILAVASDGSGNIYLTGTTGATTFPVTAGAYQTNPPSHNYYGSASYAFLTEIAPSGKILYSTYFGSDSTICEGGSYCMGKLGVTTGMAIALDSSGAVVLAGTTTATALPTTPGVFAPSCICGYIIGFPDENAGFVAKFQPGGTPQLQWSTFLNASLEEAPSLEVNGMAIDSAGNVILGGTAPPGLPATPGVFQLPVSGSSPGGGAFLLKLNNTGTAVIWGALFGLLPSGTTGLFVDAQGGIVFSGETGSSVFVARATADGSTLTDFYEGPEPVTEPIQVAGIDWPRPLPAIASTGGLAAIFQPGVLWMEAAEPGPSLLNIANSASGQYSTIIASGELVSLYGVGIGPPSPLAGQLQNGVFTSSLGGYQVLFNGLPAPLLYADSGQMNVVVPGIAEPDVIPVQLVTPTGTVDGPGITLAHTPVNGVFQNGQTGLAAALNQDGSVNSPSSPAKAGDIVAIFVNAISGYNYGIGAVARSAISTSLPVWVLDDYRSLNLAYAGYAPGLVSGVMQINFQLPDPLPAGNPFTFYVQIGGTLAAVVPGQIAVAQ